MTAPTIPQVCAAAIAEIQLHGWAQGLSAPGVCVVEAIGRVAGDEAKVRSETWRAIHRQLNLPPLTPLSVWNDDPARTKDEVIAALFEVAVVEQARIDADAELARWRDLYPNVTRLAVDAEVQRVADGVRVVCAGSDGGAR